MTASKTAQTSILQAIYRVMRENFLAQKWTYAVAIVAMVIVASSTAASAWIMKAILFFCVMF